MIGGIVAGLIVWFIVATIGSLLFRVAMQTFRD
jgi:hypothetical protein